MELELKKECLDVFEAGDRQTLTQEETAETIGAGLLPGYCQNYIRRGLCLPAWGGTVRDIRAPFG